jgi:hypothetical protein
MNEWMNEWMNIEFRMYSCQFLLLAPWRLPGLNVIYSINIGVYVYVGELAGDPQLNPHLQLRSELKIYEVYLMYVFL